MDEKITPSFTLLVLAVSCSNRTSRPTSARRIARGTIVRVGECWGDRSSLFCLEMCFVAFSPTHAFRLLTPYHYRPLVPCRSRDDAGVARGGAGGSLSCAPQAYTPPTVAHTQDVHKHVHDGGSPCPCSCAMNPRRQYYVFRQKNAFSQNTKWPADNLFEQLVGVNGRPCRINCIKSNSEFVKTGDDNPFTQDVGVPNRRHRFAIKEPFAVTVAGTFAIEMRKESTNVNERTAFVS